MDPSVGEQPGAREVVERLRRQLHQYEQARRLELQARWMGGLEDTELAQQVISTGIREWDGLLPFGGFRRGSLVEFFGQGGSGVGTVALWVARRALELAPGVLVVVERHGRFYPPAAAIWGIPLHRCIWVRVPDKALQAWAIDQALRSTAAVAVWSWVDRLEGRWSRRWQLAAESGGSIGLLVRPPSEQKSGSWADVQWLVQAQAVVVDRSRSIAKATEVQPPLRRVCLTLVRSRFGLAGGRCWLMLDDFLGQLQSAQHPEEAQHGTGTMSMATSLAYPTARCPEPGVGRSASGGARS